jgi:hypothetical protein
MGSIARLIIYTGAFVHLGITALWVFRLSALVLFCRCYFMHICTLYLVHTCRRPLVPHERLSPRSAGRVRLCTIAHARRSQSTGRQSRGAGAAATRGADLPTNARMAALHVPMRRSATVHRRTCSLIPADPNISPRQSGVTCLEQQIRVGCRGRAKRRGGINRRAGASDPFGGRRSLDWLRPRSGGYAAISKAAISVAADLRDTLAAGARGAS